MNVRYWPIAAESLRFMYVRFKVVLISIPTKFLK